MWRRPTTLIIALLAGIVACGCAEIAFIFGGGISPVGAATSQATGTTSGGTVTLNGQIPTATQPTPIAPPTYRPSLLDPLFESTSGAKGVVIVDIDGDGVLDVASISSESQPVQIHLRNTTTGLFDTISIGGGAPLSETIDIEAGDFNGDGRVDFAVLVHDTGFVPPPNTALLGALCLLIQGPDARNKFLWTRVDLVFKGTDDPGFVDISVGDFDGINGPDIALVSNEVQQAPNTPFRFVYLYTNPGGNNAFDPTQWTETTIVNEAAPLAFAIPADIDLDGDLDMVVAAPTAKSFNVRWMQNPLSPGGVAAVTNGAAWGLRMVGQQDGGAQFVAVGDIDGDGDLDVAASRVDLRLTQWFRNPGPADLAAERHSIPWEVFNVGVLTSGDINQLQLVDLDLNGTLDVMVTASGNIAAFQRQANLEDFWTPFSILATNPVAVIGKIGFADFDGNGRLDFLAPLDRPGLTQDQFVIFSRQ